MFKDFLGRNPSIYSYTFAVVGIVNSSRRMYNSIWGTPNYEKWVIF